MDVQLSSPSFWQFLLPCDIQMYKLDQWRTAHAVYEEKTSSPDLNGISSDNRAMSISVISSAVFNLHAFAARLTMDADADFHFIFRQSRKSVCRRAERCRKSAPCPCCDPDHCDFFGQICNLFERGDLLLLQRQRSFPSATVSPTPRRPACYTGLSFTANIIIDYYRFNIDALSLGKICSHFEVHNIASVVLDDV